MKFNEEILRQFNLEPEEKREPVNVMEIGRMLDFMKLCAKRIISKSRCYMECGDSEVQMDCMDIVTVKLNDFTQVFKDLILFMRRKEGTHKGGTSLRYCISSFDTFEFEETEAEQAFLRELLLRNEITHDYFNRELHYEKLIWLMTHCSEGAMDVYRNLYAYCTEHDLLGQYLDKNSG